MGATRWAIGLVILLAAADAVTTLTGIEAGRFYEINPLFCWALGIDLVFFLGLKGALTSLYAVVMFHEARRQWLKPVNVGIAGFYGGIVLRSVWYLTV